jgi:hypothetical protein
MTHNLIDGTHVVLREKKDPVAHAAAVALARREKSGGKTSSLIGEFAQLRDVFVGAVLGAEYHADPLWDLLTRCPSFDCETAHVTSWATPEGTKESWLHSGPRLGAFSLQEGLTARHVALGNHGTIGGLAQASTQCLYLQRDQLTIQPSDTSKTSLLDQCLTIGPLALVGMVALHMWVMLQKQKTTTLKKHVVAHLSFIDTLKGAAMCIMLASHSAIFPFATPGFSAWVLLDKFIVLPFAMVSNSFRVVELLNIVTGILVFLPYRTGRRTMTSLRDAWSHFLGKLLRWYPLYFVSSCVFIFSRHGTKSGSLLLPWPQTFGVMATFSFTFMNTPGHIGEPTWNPALWSLVLTVWFYALFPAILIIFKHIGSAAAVLLSCSACWWSRHSVLTAMAADSVVAGHVLTPLTSADCIWGRADDFVMGMAICDLACSFHERSITIKHPKVWGAAGILFWWLGCVVKDLIELTLCKKADAAICNLLCQLGCVYGLVPAITEALGQKPRGPCASKSPTPARCLLQLVRLIGRMSFSVMVVHTAIFDSTLSPRYRDHTSTIKFYCLVIPCVWFATLVVAWVSFEAVEKRLGSALVARFGPARKDAAPRASVATEQAQGQANGEGGKKPMAPSNSKSLGAVQRRFTRSSTSLGQL